MFRNYGALHAFIDSRQLTPFAWWTHDCVTFAARAAEAETGEDYLKRLGARWTSARGAARALSARGGLVAAVNTILRPIPHGHAARGDIGLVGIEGRESLMVIEGDLVVGPGLTGLVRAQRGALTSAWTISA